MARKGKEPAGLRKWRLAQKRKAAGRKASRPKQTRKVKTMARRRSYSRKRRGHGKKFSAWKMAKGLIYTGAIAAPMYQSYTQLGGGATGAVGTMKNAAFVDAQTGTFSLAAGAQIWTPVAAVMLVDFVTTKIPVQRYISRGVNNLLG